jgi:hypothetical protein
MPYPANPAERQPKGDHNRRLSLGLDPEQFAVAAGITVDALHEYESTSPDHDFDLATAEHVGNALDRLEQVLPNSEAAGIEQVRSGQAGEDVEHALREAAYYLWENEGRPEGREQDHWYRASQIGFGEDLDRAFREEMDFEPEPVPLSAEASERAMETSRRIGLQRGYKKDPDDNTSGGFNQKR